MCKCTLTCADLSLWHKEPWRFVTSQWQYPGRRSYGYICYRVTVAAFFFVWTIIDLATYGTPDVRSRWFIHITNWSKLFVLMDTLLQAINTCHYQLWKLRKRPPGSQVQSVSFNSVLRFCYGIEWFFTIISGVFVIVTVNVAFMESDSTGAFRAARYFSSLVYVIVDHMVHNQPKRILHVFYALFLHLFYVAFNAIYVIAGGTTASGSSVIDGIDWANTAVTAGAISLSVFLVFFAHFALWLLVRLRELFYSCASDESAIKLPLAATSGQGGAPPYGTTRQDPEGAHPSPTVTEKHPRPTEGPRPTAAHHRSPSTVSRDRAAPPPGQSRDPASGAQDNAGFDPADDVTQPPPPAAAPPARSPPSPRRDPYFSQQRYHGP